MTALPLRDFTAAEQDKLADIEAAPAAEESVRERVAIALWASDVGQPGAGRVHELWALVCEKLPKDAAAYRNLADVAIAVLSGPSSDAEQAVERVLALADEHAECCQFVAVGDLRHALAGD